MRRAARHHTARSRAARLPVSGMPARHRLAALLKDFRPLLFVLLFALALLAGVEWLGLRESLKPEAVRAILQEHPLGGLLSFVLLFALGNLAQIPGWIFLAAAVLALGRTWGGAATYVAATISCVFSFVTIRLIGGDALRRLDSALARRIFARLDARPVRSVLLLRLMFQTVPALNYALALSGVRFRHHLLGTLLGLPLPIAMYCLFFDFLARLLGVSPA